MTTYTAKPFPEKCLSQYRLLSLLGVGGEGTVYLVEEPQTRQKLVVKLFHETREMEWYAGLIDYSSKITSNDLGLSPVSLFYQDDCVTGLIAPFVQTTQRLHYRVLYAEQVAQSIIGSICQKQVYLLSNHGLALVDTKLDNLGVDQYGIWHYLDLGGGISRLSNPWLVRTGAVGYGFAGLLLSIYDINIADYIPRSDEYSYDEPCMYCQIEPLDRIANRHAWIYEILQIVRSNKAAVLHDPEFYREFSRRLPARMPLPWLTLPLSEALFAISSMRKRLKEACIVCP